MADAKGAIIAADNPGPWGVLDVRDTYLDPPASFLEVATRPDQVTLWRFPNGDVDAVRALFTRARVSDELQRELLASDGVHAEKGGLTLQPAPAAILQLTPASRQIIYAELGRESANAYFQTPLRIVGDLDDWLRESRLSEPQRKLFRQLVWRRGGCWAFSDISLLLNQAATSAEMNAALTSMARVQTLVVTLEVPATASVRSLLDYWGAGGRNSDVLPFLRSAIERQSVETIDIVHLLPPLCRDRLYTFPALASANAGRFPDCQWTSLNFFARKPEPYYLDARAGFIELTENYTAIDRPTQLGDLICLETKDGRILHSCVYVASNIVFTKNGGDLAAPWLLQHLNSVIAYYDYEGIEQLRFFRKKPEIAVGG